MRRSPASGRSFLAALAAIGLTAACGARSGLMETDESNGGAQEDAGVGIGLSDASPPPPTSVVSEAPDSASAQDAMAEGTIAEGAIAKDEDGGCSASILTYESPSATINACWTRAKERCSSQLSACAADCICNDAIGKALNCVDNGGGTVACFGNAFVSAGDSTLGSTRDCLTTAYPGGSCAGPTVDAAPTASDAARSACTTNGGGGGGGNGECSSTVGATCDGQNYQVSCECPRGTCICFGPSTRVVSFQGCPYCPTLGAAIGTTAAQVFALCGFPAYPE
jgi:hypothetical protein